MTYNSLKPEDRYEFSEFIENIKKGGQPKIYALKNNFEVKQNTKIDLYSLIKVEDAEDGSILLNSDNTIIDTSLNTAIVGEYTIKYTVYDSDKNESTKEIFVQVIPDLLSIKEKMKGAINQKAQEKKDSIDGRNDLTKEEKDAAKVQVDQEAQKAKDAIDAASTQEAVNQAKEAGTTAIDGVNPNVTDKPAAKEAVDQKAQEKKDSIDGRNDLTKEEKDAVKAQVDQEAQKAKDAIDAAITQDAVSQEKKAGIIAIESIKSTEPSDSQTSKSYPLMGEKFNSKGTLLGIFLLIGGIYFKIRKYTKKGV